MNMLSSLEGKVLAWIINVGETRIPGDTIEATDLQPVLVNARGGRAAEVLIGAVTESRYAENDNRGDEADHDRIFNGRRPALAASAKTGSHEGNDREKCNHGV